MRRFDLPICDNPLETREDVQEAVRQLCSPLKHHFSPGRALVCPGNTSAVYTDRTAGMEGFSRIWWGLAPLMAGGGDTDLWSYCVEGLRNGTDPEHIEYWGDMYDFSQLAVEMPPLALALILAPDKTWGVLSEQAKQNVAVWLRKINDCEVPDNNWRFFGVLVNLALKNVGETYSREMMDAALDRIDEFYLSDGWYSDGFQREQRDYYVSYALHYYGLIYARIAEKDGPVRADKFKERATLFARDFMFWFAADGSAIPFGRSLTYRFAQTAFWSALAFAGVEAVPWGVVKGIVLRNMRWWFQHPIFSPAGVLSIGYGYPNLIMSESYNAPGSPYWAFKSFLPLALPEEHPFWTAEEMPLPELNDISVQTHPHMVLCRSEKGRHVVALTSGQWAKFEPVHCAAKYAKFAYSNLFAFSVPREGTGLEKGAYDSMLALNEGDGYWRVRRKCESARIEDQTVISIWKPWDDVEIETWIVPANPWHVRVHRVRTARYLELAEGGYAIPCDGEAHVDSAAVTYPEHPSVHVEYESGISGIVNLHGSRNGRLVHAKPNTNLMYPRTVIPTLVGAMEPGEHWLAAAVLAGESDETRERWTASPNLVMSDGEILVEFGGTRCRIGVS